MFVTQTVLLKTTRFLESLHVAPAAQFTEVGLCHLHEEPVRLFLKLVSSC